MALVLPSDEDPVEPGKLDGVLFFSGTGGRLVARNLVSPVQPYSVRQSAERNWINQASRIWRWVLDESERDDWRESCGADGNGSTALQAACSSFGSAGLGAVSVRLDPACPEVPVFLGGFIFSQPFGLVVTMDEPVTVGAYFAFFVRPAASSGGFRRKGRPKLVAVAEAEGGDFDLTAGYLSVFGAVPLDFANAMVYCRLLDPALPQASELVSLELFGAEQAPDFMASLTPNPADVVAGFSQVFDLSVDVANDPPSRTYDLDWYSFPIIGGAGSGWVSPPDSVTNGSPVGVTWSSGASDPGDLVAVGVEVHLRPDVVPDVGSVAFIIPP